MVETGEVAEVFSHPQSAAGRKLVFPETETGDSLSLFATPGSDQQLIRVTFTGAQATGTPLIAHMAVEMGIEANIAAASTKSIGGRIYGTMLLGIPGGEEVTRTAIDYLTRTPDIRAEEVTANVQ